MARAKTITLLPLDRFAEELGINPLHFNQFQGGLCGSTIFQMGWQKPGQIGREDIARAIAHAEARITDILKFFPAPRWTEEVTSFGTRSIRPILVNRYGMVVDAGQLTMSELELDVQLEPSDDDEDGLDETFTAEVETSIADPEEIAVFYPGKSGDPAWEIRPVDITISGGTATIKMKRWQIVKPQKTEAVMIAPEDVDGLDPEDDDVLLTTVDVYERFMDPSLQAQFEGYHDCQSCRGRGSPCDVCAQHIITGCVDFLSPQTGVLGFHPATWDDENLVMKRGHPIHYMPAKMRYWIRSGWVDPMTGSKLVMDPRLARAVSLYALTLLNGGLCDCLKDFYDVWCEDIAKSESQDTGTTLSTSYKMAPETLKYPLGTTRGGIEAFRLVREVGNSAGIA